MSKKIIAGLGVVAGLAVALAPVATFAENKNTYTSDEHTDAFSIRVKDTCAFGSDATGAVVTGVAHNTGAAGTIGVAGEYDGTATWNNTDTANQGRRPDNANGTPNVGTDTASYAIEAGTEKAGFAQTTLKVYCNNATNAKYTLTVTANNLTDGNGNTIPVNADYTALASGYAIDGVTASTGTSPDDHGALASGFGASTKWGPTPTSPDTATAETTMATSSKGTLSTGDEYVINYGIGIQASQTAGTYTGNVIYKLYQGIDAA